MLFSSRGNLLFRLHFIFKKNTNGVKKDQSNEKLACTQVNK